MLGYTELFPDWMPPWGISVITFAVAIAVALIAQSFLFRILMRQLPGKDALWRSLVPRAHGPIALGAIILALSAAATLAPLPAEDATGFRQFMLLCFILLAGWVAVAALNIWTTIYLSRFKIEAADNLLARKHITQTRILLRIGNILIGTVAIAAGLMSFPGVRQIGVSLLASAGAAGLVAGLALQPLLKNIFAGIQLAITQPIRIDDALLVEGEWGKVEEITSTFVVIRIWDWRRLVVPLNYFLENPFQNWTKEGAELIGSVMFYLDYAIPVSVVRDKAQEIVHGSPLWDKRVFVTQVTDLKETTMELRVLASAPDSGKAFDLRCALREQVIDFLRREYPQAFPRVRAEMAPLPGSQALTSKAGNGHASEPRANGGKPDA